MSKYFGQEIIFGTYFLNVWLDEIGYEDMTLAFQELQKNIEANPFKQIPILIKVGVNTTNEINDKEERISFVKATVLLDKAGGLQSPETIRLIEDFTQSALTSISKSEEGKPKPKVKRIPKK